jgi:hypothetical protein
VVTPRVEVTITEGQEPLLLLDGRPVLGTVVSVVQTTKGDTPRVIVQLPEGLIAAPAGQSAAGFVASLNPVALQRLVEDYGDMDTSFGEAVVAVLGRLAAQQ